MAANNNSCIITPRKQHFVYVNKLHVLGAYPALDTNTGNMVFDTVDTVQKELNSIKHGIYRDISLHSGLIPTHGAFNTLDSFDINSNSRNNGNILEWLSDTYGDTDVPHSHDNSYYHSTADYIPQLKNILYSEISYALSRAPYGGGEISSFYEIPYENKLNFGLIQNKKTKWNELCLIDEGSEKSYFTLESKLYTYPGNRTEYSSNKYVYNTYWSNFFDYPGDGYLGYPVCVQQTPAQRRGYFFSMAGENTTDIDDGKVTCNIPVKVPGLTTNNGPFDKDRYIKSPTLKDLNPDESLFTQYNGSFYATRYNFFLSGQNFSAPQNEPCALYSAENENYAIHAANSTYDWYGISAPINVEQDNEIGLGIIPLNSGSIGIDAQTSNTQFARYYIPQKFSPAKTPSSASSAFDYSNTVNFRYIGNILSSSNAYTSLLGVTNGGKIARLPEVVFGAGMSSEISPYNNMQPSISYGDPGVGTRYNINIQQNTYVDRYGFSKQTNETTFDILYESWPEGYIGSRTSLKSSAENFINNSHYLDSGTTLIYGSGSGSGLDKFKQEGYLYDRDVILINKGADCNNTLNSHNVSHNGLYTLNTQDLESSILSTTGTFPRELEFELYYCANINNPYAAQNLFNFARKLNKLTSGFNTGILSSKSAHFADPNANDIGENEYVHIQELKSYEDSYLIYGSEEVVSNIGTNSISDKFYTNDPDEVYTVDGQSHITSKLKQYVKCTVTPIVKIHNVYIWENCGVPKWGSKVLRGDKSAHDSNGNPLYTYGKYFLAYFAHNLYLIDKVTFDNYMYTATEFKDYVNELLDPNNNGIADNSTYADPYIHYNEKMLIEDCIDAMIPDAINENTPLV